MRAGGGERCVRLAEGEKGGDDCSGFAGTAVPPPVLFTKHLWPTNPAIVLARALEAGGSRTPPPSVEVDHATIPRSFVSAATPPRALTMNH